MKCLICCQCKGGSHQKRLGKGVKKGRQKNEGKIPSGDLIQASAGTVKTFSVMPTHMVNTCAKFYIDAGGRKNNQ